MISLSTVSGTAGWEYNTMAQINLSRPTGSHKARSGFGKWRTVFEYRCQSGHKVEMFANAFRGSTPEPGVGAIECPQCEFHRKYGGSNANG